MPRFIVLEHAAPRGRHWDLMLETHEALTTWALAEPPDTAASIPAEALPDHRLAYLDYEGPGELTGGRGQLLRWDAGTLQLESRSDAQLVATLSGAKLVGRVTLTRSEESSNSWQFRYVPHQPLGR